MACNHLLRLSLGALDDAVGVFVGFLSRGLVILLSGGNNAVLLAVSFVNDAVAVGDYAFCLGNFAGKLLGNILNKVSNLLAVNDSLFL